LSAIRAKFVLCLVVSMCCEAALSESAFEPVQHIAESAIRAVAPDAANNTRVQAQASVDTALRMPRCDKPLQALVSRPGVAEVACNGSTAWKLYVPVRVSRISDVLVLVRPIGSGQPFDRSMVQVEARDTGSLSGETLASAEDIQGYNAARPLSPGHTLVRADLLAPRVIRRGDQVVIVFNNGHVEVRSQGKALRDGAIGDLINVENQSSRRQIQARIVGPGKVETVQ
jgi:flagella basal body P-ring formation protein FlgA